MPLSMIQVGQKARIIRVSGLDATKKHLGSLGFTVGTVVSIVCATDDNLIVAIHDSRIAINGDIANHVFIEVL